MTHSRHVGTHIQRDKRRDKISPIPQTKKRTRIAVASTYGDALRTIDTSQYPVESLQIRRMRDGFGIFYREPIESKKTKRVQRDAQV